MLRKPTAVETFAVGFYHADHARFNARGLAKNFNTVVHKRFVQTLLFGAAFGFFEQPLVKSDLAYVFEQYPQRQYVQIPFRQSDVTAEQDRPHRGATGTDGRAPR